jgi:murein DD-endopeptidase MepM/ murein hydrolase activator NlpD
VKIANSQQLVLFRRSIRRRCSGRIVAPVVNADTLKPYPVTFGYGVPTATSSSGRHRGEDHACPPGSLALAVSWGVVVHVTDRGGPVPSWGSAYGVHVVIRTATGLYDYGLCHLSRATVTPGQKVKPGQVVGFTGQSGNVTGPHLHLEARPAGGRLGTDINPRIVKRRPATLPTGAHQ